jgi:hypothetical protein
MHRSFFKGFMIIAVVTLALTASTPPGWSGTYIEEEYNKKESFKIANVWHCTFSKLLFSSVLEFWRWGEWESFELMYQDTSRRGYNHHYRSICYRCSHTSGNSYDCYMGACQQGSAASGDRSGQVTLAPGVTKEQACQTVFEKLHLK